MNNIGWLSKPLERGSVSKYVLERIKEALLNKDLKPGDYLPSESVLAKGFGVGKSSVREAIKMLEAMGVVEIKRGQGTIIREHPAENDINSLLFQLILQQGGAQEIIDLRAMFEIAYTVMAMERATQEDKKRIEQTILQYEEQIKKGEQKVQNDLAFHRAILESTHNFYVIKIGETILQLFKSSIRKSVLQTPVMALDDHRKIYQAFCEKDEKRIRAIILDSLERWRANID